MSALGCSQLVYWNIKGMGNETFFSFELMEYAACVLALLGTLNSRIPR